MAASIGYQWPRDRDGLDVWEHRGKVAVAGVGHSPVDRRWDGVSLDRTLGAHSKFTTETQRTPSSWRLVLPAIR